MKVLKSKVGIIAIVVVILLVAVGSISFLMPGVLPFSPTSSTSGQEDADPTPTRHVRKTGPGTGITYAMNERILNLKGSDLSRYLKITVVVEFESEKNTSKMTAEEIKKEQTELSSTIAPKVPLLNDAITSIVTTKEVKDLTTAEGKEKLREELKTKFEELVGDPPIIQVYFTDFVMQ